MCGIFGFISSNAAPAGYERFVRDAFMSGSVRGDHGSGMIAVNAAGVVEHRAAAVSGYEFVSLKAYDDICSKVGKAVAVVGHNRYATAGRHVDEHCHPFSFGDVVGVHNGSVPPYTLNQITNFSHPVDSARIYHAINEAKSPLDVLQQLHTGAYALVWYNKADKAIYMARNSERPLHMIAGDTGLSFASEAGMLTWLAGRNLLYTSTHNMVLLDTHTLYKFPLDDLAAVSATQYKAERPAYIPPVDYSRGRYWPDMEDDYSYGWEKGASKTGPWPWGSAPRAKPCAKPYMNHFTMTHLETQHPQLHAEVAQMKDNFTYPKGHLQPSVQVTVFGGAESIGGISGLYGVLMRPDSNAPVSGIPVFIATHTDALQRHHEQVLEKTALVEPPGECFSVMEFPVDKFVATADGFMFISATAAVHDQPLKYLHSFDANMQQFCLDTVSGADLRQLSGKQIQAAWESVLYNSPAQMYM